MKVTGICWFMMTTLIVSSFSTAAVAYRLGPKTCDGFSDANGYCEVTNNGWRRQVHCFDDYIYSEDWDNCSPEKKTGVYSRSLETCDGFSDVNAVCKVKSDGSGASHLCKPGYVFLLNSDTCTSKADVRGYSTCQGFSAANSVCEVIDNGWAIIARCLDGYNRVPNTQHCTKVV